MSKSKTLSNYLFKGDRTGATSWRYSRIFSVWRLFFGFTAQQHWKTRYVRRSTTMKTFTPGARYLTRSGPSLAVKIPGLPFEIVVGFWKAYVFNVFADSPGVRAVSIGSDPATAMSMDAYRASLTNDARPPSVTNG